jgi:hypothetical protein
MLSTKATIAAVPAVNTGLTALTSMLLSALGTTTPVLMSGIVGAMISLYFNRTSEKVWIVVLGILSKGVFGAWMSEALPHFALTSFTKDMKQEALAGLCAILIQVIYNLITSYGDSLTRKFRNSNAKAEDKP